MSTPASGDSLPPTTPRPRISGSPVRSRWILCGVSLFVSLGLAELVARALWTNPWAERPARAFMLRELPPGRQWRFKGPDGALVEDATDSRGFLVPSNRYARPDLRIAFLGGSTTRCPGLSARDRWPLLAVEDLERRTGARIDLLNAGVSANVVIDSTLLYLAKLETEPIDCVVVMQSFNDARNHLWGFRYASRSLRITGPQTPVDLASGHSALFGLVREARARWLIRRQGVAPALWRDLNGWGRARQYPLADGVIREGTARYAGDLRSLVVLVKSRGSRVALVTEPTVYRSRVPSGDATGLWMTVPIKDGVASLGAMADATDAYNEVVRDVARAEGCILIDLARNLPYEREYFRDDCHYTAAGSRRVGQIVAAGLQEWAAAALEQRHRREAPAAGQRPGPAGAG